MNEAMAQPVHESIIKNYLLKSFLFSSSPLIFSNVFGVYVNAHLRWKNEISRIVVCGESESERAWASND